MYTMKSLKASHDFASEFYDPWLAKILLGKNQKRSNDLYEGANRRMYFYGSYSWYLPYKGYNLVQIDPEKPFDALRPNDVAVYSERLFTLFKREYYASPKIFGRYVGMEDGIPMVVYKSDPSFSPTKCHVLFPNNAKYVSFYRKAG